MNRFIEFLPEENIPHQSKKKTIQLIQRTRERCTACGFRIRGENHSKGRHHRMAVKK